MVAGRNGIIKRFTDLNGIKLDPTNHSSDRLNGSHSNEQQ